MLEVWVLLGCVLVWVSVVRPFLRWRGYGWWAQWERDRDAMLKRKREEREPDAWVWGYVGGKRVRIKVKARD